MGFCGSAIPVFTTWRAMGGPGVASGLKPLAVLIIHDNPVVGGIERANGKLHSCCDPRGNMQILGTSDRGDMLTQVSLEFAAPWVRCLGP